MPLSRTRSSPARRSVTAMFLGVLVAGCSGSRNRSPPAPLSEIVVPATYDPARAAPLVVFLHPYGFGSANIVADCDAWLELRTASASRGVLLALPLGSIDARGARYWNGAGCCDFDGSNPDQVAFLKAVVADAKSRFNVDPKKVFFLGHSSGGFMAHRMACEASELVAAIVSIAGDVWKDSARCTPATSVSVLQVHGDADAIIPYAGGLDPLFGTTLDLPSARASIATWATLDGCTGSLVDTGGRLDLDTSVAGAETKVERFDCPAGAAELWTMQGSGHAPPFAVPSSTEALIDWLVAHPKP